MVPFEEAFDTALLAFGRGSGLARAEAERVARDYPERPEGLALVAMGRLGSGDLEGAREIALGEDPVSRALLAALLAHEGKREEAKSEMEAALALAPDHPIVLRLVSGVLGLDDPERGLALAHRAVSLRPHDPLSYWTLWAPLTALGRTEETDVLIVDPPPGLAGSPTLALMGSLRASLKGDALLAERLAREAVALGPDLISPWTRLASLLVGDGRLDGAEEAVRRALAINPRAPAALGVLARIAEGRGDAKEAARVREAARRASVMGEELRAVDEVRRHFVAGRHDDALAALDRLGGLPPFVQKAAFPYRVRMLTLLGSDGALRQVLAGSPPNDVHAIVGEAELLLRNGRFAEARGLLEAEWGEGRPSVVAAYLVRAYAGCDRDRAGALAEELIDRPPDNALDAYFTLLALAKARLGGEVATRYLRAVERKYPSYGPIREFRAGVLMRTGRFHEAWRVGETLEGSGHKRFRSAFGSRLARATIQALWRRVTGNKR